MNILFRVDGGLNIGAGHIIRCLSLAHQLRRNNHRVCFAIRFLDNFAASTIKASGFNLKVIEVSRNVALGSLEEANALKNIVKQESPDWIVFDHYNISNKYERVASLERAKIFVIDDIANRNHICDILLDQNYNDNHELRYKGLIPSNTKKLFGVKYALLRKEFAEYHQKIHLPKSNSNEILVMFGGSDVTNETAKAISALLSIDQFKREKINVIVGSGYSFYSDLINKWSERDNIAIMKNVHNVASIMKKCYFAVGAGGTTTWERVCLGLGSLVSVVADNQSELTQKLAANGFVRQIDLKEHYSIEDYRSKLQKLSRLEIDLLAERAFGIVDGKGCERVVSEMEKHLQ